MPKHSERKPMEEYKILGKTELQDDIGNKYELELVAFAIGIPQYLINISLKGYEPAFSIGVDRRSLQGLEAWFANAVLSVETLEDVRAKNCSEKMSFGG